MSVFDQGKLTPVSCEVPLLPFWNVSYVMSAVPEPVIAYTTVCCCVAALWTATEADVMTVMQPPKNKATTTRSQNHTRL